MACFFPIFRHFPTPKSIIKIHSNEVVSHRAKEHISEMGKDTSGTPTSTSPSEVILGFAPLSV